MNIERYIPPQDLIPYFREYYYCHFTTGEATFVPVVDDGCYDLVFFLEQDSVLEFGPSREQLPVPFKTFTIHDLNPPYKILLRKSLRFFTIKVQPWLNSSFFSVGHEQGILEIHSFLSKRLTRLHSGLFEAVNNTERFKLADDFLRTHIREVELQKDGLIASVCQTIYERKGLITVKELEAATKFSRQYLNQRFKKQVYYGIKDFIIIVRIMDLIKRKMNFPELSFTAVAMDYEYFDQAHFNRDFKRVTGLPPGKFFKDLAPFLLRHRP